jgi:hypothetical protein
VGQHGDDLGFGDAVVISPNASARFRPGASGWVVALHQQRRELLTIEFEDGTSVNVPPGLVEKSGDS